MSLWLPITILSWLSSRRSSAKMLFCLLLFSTLTGVSVVSGLSIGVQPVYLIVYVTFYFIALSILARKEELIKVPILIGMLFLFAIYAGLVTLVADKVNYGQIFYVFTIPCVTLFSFYLSQRLTFEKVTEYIFKVSIVIFVYGLIDVVLNYFGLPSLEDFLVNSSSVANNTWATANGVPRATSVFPEPSYLGVYSAVIFLYCLSIFTTKGKKVIPLLKQVTILSISNLILTASLSGFGVLLAGVGFLILITIISGSITRIYKLIRYSFVVLVLLTAIYFVVSLVSPLYAESLKIWILMRLEFSDASTITRTSSLADGYELGFANPLGLGLGNFTSADLFSTVAGSLGIIGVIIFGLWFIVPILKGIFTAVTRKINLSNLPFYMIFLSLLVAFSTGLGHFIILWPWVFIGIAIRFINNKYQGSSQS